MSSSASVPEPLDIAGVLPLVGTWRVDREFDYSCEGLSVRPGTIVQVPFGGRSVRGVVTRVDRGVPERPLLAIKKVVVDTPVVAPPLDVFLDRLATRYIVPRSLVYERMVPPRVRVASQPRAHSDVVRHASALEGMAGSTELLRDIEQRRHGVWCLRPPWGSDRGRIVTDLIDAVTDGTALVSVPEIAYGSEVVDAITERWPDAVRIDSTQEPRDRARALLELANGGRIGVGGRAAVFAPSPEVGLIVVDDEHAPSYKEDRTPRFDARVAMIERARIQKAVVVLISAHPRVETGFAASSGRFSEVHSGRARERAGRPQVEFVDKPRDASLSRALHRRIKETLAAGERVGLLVPSAGYSRALWCAECRHSVRCPRCESGVRFDRAGRRVECSRCGFTAAPPDACPNCGSLELRFLGAGSERFEEQIAKAFPRARVVRVDASTIRSLERSDDSDIYVTTWIGTKPQLRPNVALVGVVDADALLRRVDFRAAEHAYQAFSEMAEWTGPAGTGGRLVIQTDDPGHHALQAIARADYGFFLRHEIAERRDLGYPPFSELIEIRAPGIDSIALRRAAEICRGAQARVIGPAPLVGGGASVVCKCRDAYTVSEALREFAASPEGRSLSYDVDPR